MRKVILLGSARSRGNTRKAIEPWVGQAGVDFLDLKEFQISPFDYDHQNAGDDFIPLIQKLLSYELWVIATPVYWYSMSTLHKIFFDRFSDLLTLRKDLGRQLRGKKMFVVATFGTSYPEGFEATFQQMCGYLGMEYLGASFIYSGTENEEFLGNNRQAIQKAQGVLQA